MKLHWEFLHPKMTDYFLGHIGKAMTESSPLSAREQINQLYPFGGWRPTLGDSIKHLGNYNLKYPGDPVMRPIARAKLRDEIICIYQSEFWAVFQPDGSFEVARLD
jgi:hypothetical protein